MTKRTDWNDLKARYEIGVVDDFLKGRGERDYRLRNGQPPEPDVICEYKRRSVGYEVVSIVDQRLEEQIGLARKISERFTVICHDDGNNLFKRPNDCLEGAHITGALKDKLPDRATIRQVLQHLCELTKRGDPAAIDTTKDQMLARVFTHLDATPWDYPEPFLDLCPTAWINVDGIDLIGRKLQKQYSRCFPIELLAHVPMAWTPSFGTPEWKLRLEQIIRESGAENPFSCIWVFEFGGGHPMIWYCSRDDPRSHGQDGAGPLRRVNRWLMKDQK